MQMIYAPVQFVVDQLQLFMTRSSLSSHHTNYRSGFKHTCSLYKISLSYTPTKCFYCFVRDSSVAYASRLTAWYWFDVLAGLHDVAVLRSNSVLFFVCLFVFVFVLLLLFSLLTQWFMSHFISLYHCSFQSFEVAV